VEKLDDKKCEVKRNVFDDHGVTDNHFKYSCEFYRKGTSDHLEKYGKGKVETSENID